MDNEKLIVIWDSNKIEKPEFRLYYDEKGSVVTYTCEKLEGRYILIDATAFAEARPDVRVLDGKLVKNGLGAVISRLYPSDEGILTTKEDISIITETNGQYWKLETKSL